VLSYGKASNTPQIKFLKTNRVWESSSQFKLLGLVKDSLQDYRRSVRLWKVILGYPLSLQKQIYWVHNQSILNYTWYFISDVIFWCFLCQKVMLSSTNWIPNSLENKINFNCKKVILKVILWIFKNVCSVKGHCVAFSLSFYFCREKFIHGFCYF